MAVPGSSMGSELMVPGAGAGSQRWLLGTLLEYVCYQELEEIQVSTRREGAGAWVLLLIDILLYVQALVCNTNTVASYGCGIRQVEEQ